MAEFKFKISTDASGVLSGLGKFKEGVSKAIDAAIRNSARELLKDCRPYVPLLTGRLRDSGKVVQELEDFAYSVVWDAANPKNGYVYAEIQYDRVLQHVDGRYAAKWVEKVFRENPDKYTRIAYEQMAARMAILFPGQGNF